MRKVKEVILIIVGVTILAGMLFFAVDSNRVKQGKTPIFCIRNLAGIYRDGGTTEYFGLGYKVIDFNMLNGYDEIKIGTWFMDYNDFKDEFEKLNNIAEIDTRYASLEDLPEEYSLEQAVNDGCFVITPNKIYNKHILENFINNTEINAKERKEDTIRIVQYTIEGDPIITEVSFKIEGNNPKYDSLITTNYAIKVDNTRDKLSSEESRKITTNEDFPGSFYGITETEKDDVVDVTLAIYAEICYATPDAHIYEDYIICSYSKDATVENSVYSFYATVVESNSNSIMVEPYENEAIRKSTDKISIGLGEYNDAIYPVGTNVKITYDGMVMETYPAQIIATNIEVKSTDNFELSFYAQNLEGKIQKLVDKNETDKYDYNIYAYEGDVDIKIGEEYLSLRDALLNNKITMDEIIQKANKDIPNAEIYLDGGSIEYHYPTYTIIKLHKLDGNRDVYIGNPNLNINDLNL